MNGILKFKQGLGKIPFIIFCIFLALALIIGVGSSWKSIAKKIIDALFLPKAERVSAGQINQDNFFTKPVLADNIYPMFLCPCCGLPLDKKNICCGMAGEMINYIDSLAAKNLSEKEIILAFVKKYGLNSLTDKEKQNEVREWLAEAAPADRPMIALSSAYYDMGDVSQKKGVVSTLFELKNEGTKDLIINNLDSSCGCTSASIIFNGIEGPRFAMAGHGIESPTSWQVAIPVGKTASLKVYYDPDVHKDFRGPATREVSIFSNDPIDFEKKVKIDLNQVD